MNQSHTLER
jgi:hypothetical protein